MAGPVVPWEHGTASEEEEELDEALEELLLTRSGPVALAFGPMSRGRWMGMPLHTRLAAGTHKMTGGWEVGNPIQTGLY